MNEQLKEVLEKINRQHDYYDWDFGPGWGAATSCPYRTRRYLSKEASDAIVSEVKSILKTWEKKLRKIPAKQRMLDKYGYELCPELNNGGTWKFKTVGNEECMLRTVTVPSTVSYWDRDVHVTREVRMAVYVQPIFVDFNRGKHSVKTFSPDKPGSWKLEWTWAKQPDFGTCGRSFVNEVAGNCNSRLFWDKELNQFYVIYETKVSTDPIPPEMRKTNWARSRKHKEFMQKCRELQKKLLNAGIEIVRIIQDGYTHVPWAGCRNAYVECVWPGEIGKVSLAES